MKQVLRLRGTRFALIPLPGVTGAVLAQDRPEFSGMYSDRAGLEDFFRTFWCTDTGLDHLIGLLDDPANDERPVMELYTEAARHQVHMDGRAVPDDLALTPMGYSIGRYEGDALVIETRGITENVAPNEDCERPTEFSRGINQP